MQRKTYNAKNIATLHHQNWQSTTPSNAININHMMALLLISDVANTRTESNNSNFDFGHHASP